MDMGMVCSTDMLVMGNEIIGMAKHYYDEEQIDVGKAISFEVKMMGQRALSPKDKAELQQKAKDNFLRKQEQELEAKEKKRKQQEKDKAKKAKEKEQKLKEQAKAEAEAKAKAIQDAQKTLF
jgi:hypothetical protein